MKPRQYQIELFQQSILKNSIVYLETGSGKTLISILIMEHFLQHSDCIVFLAPTNALVQQQSESIESFLDCPVAAFSSSDTLNMWDQNKDHKLFIMTPQSLLNLLTHGFLKMEEIDLLVMDECHKSSKQQPLSLIMTQYYHKSIKKPRVFGMTASPLYQGSLTVEDAYKRLKEIQMKLDCTIIKISDHLGCKYVNQAQEHIIVYQEGAIQQTKCYELFCALKFELIECLCGLVQYKGSITNGIEKLQKEIRERIDELDMKEKNGLAVLERQVFGLDVVVEQYGAFAGYLFAKKVYDSVNGTSKKRKRISEENSKEIVPTKSEISDKVHCLVQLIKKYLKPTKQCIVFVDRRDCAEALCDLLNHLSMTYSLSLKCGFASGRNTTTLESTLGHFRNGMLNVLVSTRVMVEGIDIPKCQLVVMADTFRSHSDYIQSRGRARDANSRYVLMVREGDIQTFKSINAAKKAEAITKQLISDMTSRNELIEIQNQSEGLWEDIVQGLHDDSIQTQTGAVLYPSGSIPVLLRYLSSIGTPKITYTQEWPNRSWDVVYPEMLESLGTESQVWKDSTLGLNEPPFGFVYSLSLLIHGEKRTIYGGLRMTKKMAQKHVCYIACKLLYSVKLLDEHMLPVAPPIIQEFPEVEDDWIIPRKIPTSFMKNPQDLGETTKLFLTIIDISTELKPNVRFSNEAYVGIVTHYPFFSGDLKPIPLYVNGHFDPLSATCVLRPGQLVELDPVEMKLLSTFQTEIWKLILASRREENVDTSMNSLVYYIAPLSKQYQWQIDWDHIDLVLHRMFGLNEFWHKWEPVLEDLIIQTPHNHCVYTNPKKTSKMPTESFAKRKKGKEVQVSFVDYFSEFGYTIDPQKSMLMVKRPTQIPSSTLPVELEGAEEGEIMPTVEIYLPREACQVYPVSFSFLAHLKAVPYIIYHMETQALITDFFQVYQPMNHEVMEECMYALSSEMPINYERLETLGDSFLKFAVGLDLFKKQFSKARTLSSERSSIVSNKNLQLIAVRHNLHTWIQTNPFLPQHFNPPAFVEVPKVEELLREVKPKKQADFIEALCGGYLVSNGFDSAWNFLCFCGLVDPFTTPTYSHSVSEFQRNSLVDLNELFGHTFCSKDILSQIIAHPTTTDDHYEVFEFLGDAILDFLVIRYYFQKYTKATPGELSMMKAIIVNNDVLSFLCYQSGLYKHIRADFLHRTTIQEYEEYASTQSSPLDETEFEPPKLLADVFEAVIGGIFLDTNGDLDYTWSKVFPIFEPILEQISPHQQLRNPTRLFREQVHQLGVGFEEIKYYFRGESSFECEIIIRGQSIGIGNGNSKRYAKRNASQRGLEWLDLNSRLL